MKQILSTIVLLMLATYVQAQNKSHISIQANGGISLLNQINKNPIPKSRYAPTYTFGGKLLFNKGRYSFGLNIQATKVSRSFDHSYINGSDKITHTAKIEISSPAINIGIGGEYVLFKGIYVSADMGYLLSLGDGDIKTEYKNGVNEPQKYQYGRATGVNLSAGLGYRYQIARHVSVFINMQINNAWLKTKEENFYYNKSFQILYLPTSIGIKYNL